MYVIKSQSIYPAVLQPDGYMCSYDLNTLKITSLSQNIPNAKSLINASIYELIPQNVIDVIDSKRRSIELLSKQGTITQMCDIAADEIKRISEFDRVMVYKFDQEKNGSVISEVKEDGIDSYLGWDDKL